MLIEKNISPQTQTGANRPILYPRSVICMNHILKWRPDICCLKHKYMLITQNTIGKLQCWMFLLNDSARNSFPVNIQWVEFYKLTYLSLYNYGNITSIYSIYNQRLDIMEMSIDIFDKARPIISHAACHHVISHSVLIYLNDVPPTNWIDTHIQNDVNMQLIVFVGIIIKKTWHKINLL